MSTPGTVIALPSEEDFHKERYKCIQADDGINWYRFYPMKIDLKLLWKCLPVLTILACIQTSVADNVDCNAYLSPWVAIDCPHIRCSIDDISMYDVSSGQPKQMTKNCSRSLTNSDLVQCLTFNANKVQVTYPDKDHPNIRQCSIITIIKEKGTQPPAPVTPNNVISTTYSETISKAFSKWFHAIVGILTVGFTLVLLVLLVLLAMFCKHRASRVCRSCLSANSGGRNGANKKSFLSRFRLAACKRSTQATENYPLANNNGDKPATAIELDGENYQNP